MPRYLVITYLVITCRDNHVPCLPVQKCAPPFPAIRRREGGKGGRGEREREREREQVATAYDDFNRRENGDFGGDSALLAR